MRRCPRGHRRSVDRGVHRPAIEPRKYPHPGCRRGFRGAAGVPLAALTALQALRDELGVKPEHKVFISGGAGAVGTFAIQIAKWLGAHVTTTASQRGEALARSLGADEVIDYTNDDLSRIGKDFDAGLDLIGGETLDKMFKIMKPGSKIVSVAAVPEPQTALLDLGG